MINLSLEFHEYKLGDLCNISSSKRIFAREYVDEGIPFYRGKEIIELFNNRDVSTELFITTEKYESIKEKYGVPGKGDILLSSVGTLGVPYLVKDEKFYFKDGNLTWFKDFNSKLNNKFLYWWLQSIDAKYQINNKCIGSTQKALPIKTLEKFDINLPPLKTQEQIVEILDNISNKIKVNISINKNLFNIASSLQIDWMVNFSPFKSKQFKSSSFGIIPEDWNVGKLGDVIEILDSKRIPLSGQERENMEKIYPYYGAASLMDYVEDYIFDGIYLLIGEDGTVIDDKGFPILQYVWGKFWVNNHAHIVKGKNGFNVDSLYLLLSKTNIQSIVTGAVQAKVNQNNLKSLEIIIPPVEVMEKFNELIEPFFDEIRLNHDEIKKLQNLRDTLLPKLMSGEIDVSEIDCYL